MSELTQSPELEKAVHLVLSRFIGTQGGTRAMARPLANVVQAIDEEAETRWRCGHSAMRSLGLTPRDLDNRWAVARANGQLLARPVLEAFFPAVGWPQFARLITLGPQAATQRAEAVMSCWAQGLEVDGSKRPALSTKTIDMQLVALHRFMRELCELRKLAVAGQVDVDATVLAGWEPHLVPKRTRPEDLGARDANTDRSAPSLRGL